MFVSFLGWNHAGRLSLCLKSSVRLCLVPELRMAFRSWGSCLCMKHLHLMKDCKKMSVRMGPWGLGPICCCWVQVRMISRAASEARGQEVEWSVSFLSFIILIALFLTLRFRTFRLPLL